ncbi:pimeloyl-ACP methyl ester carboxylesterase [Streptomyces aurantiacus]|uniref:alpha/beta fold hydrolase n=1 Tax=Streptomyces aurantiacus TaxID=47760 RepID=UPI00278D756A|nr:alpha/beta hydrolase [Streptomyces aurantiacus]MDQ0775667.1 pimeloyl-ACP methyl ester carboxylesterase [Streptomyces aurantiacus]
MTQSTASSSTASSSTTSPAGRRSLRRTAVVALSALALAGIPVAAYAVNSGQAATTTGTHAARATARSDPKPTVVLVHGAFADSSGWYGVMDKLRKDGYPVRALNTPLRGLDSDAAYIRGFLDTVKGPIILVGHSYGGAVITNAAAGDPDVKALVYVAALVPDAGEKLTDVTAHPVTHPLPAQPLQAVPITGADGTRGVELTLDPAKFRAFFAADVSPGKAADMADAQNSVNVAAFNQPSAAAAWRTIPSWYLVAKQDRILSPELERWMAKRAGARTVEINSSHAAMVSHPGAVKNLIEQADRGTD